MNITAGADKPGPLLVDDDAPIIDTLSLVLGQHFEVCSAGDRLCALDRLERMAVPPPLALVDLGLPPTPHDPAEGYRLIGALMARAPLMKIVVLSGQSEEIAGRHARSLGATEFVAKPARPADLLNLLENVMRVADAERVARSDPPPAGTDPLDALVGASPAMRGLKTQIRLYADSPFPVLIEGESGSGKEIVASALHALSGRRDRASLALNCAAIAPSLVEPTLFGYAKGAFTGAGSAGAGYFEEAQDGTLFLDEIGELPLELQAKLLRVLENGEYNRVGETQPRKSRARIVAATNRNLRAESKSGGFRPDLYHRLSVFSIRVPPLRELADDKLALFAHFRDLYASAAGARACELDREARALWLDYPFPGNVRELRNVVIRLATKHPPGAMLKPADLEPELDSGVTVTPRDDTGEGTLESIAAAELQQRRYFNLDARMASWERAYIAAAMKIAGGNISRAARLLGVNRTTLYSRMSALERES